ncbi:MAG: oligoendopeptidase F, partial [Proteobacteria bacterium]|nr:oligoendopeptidase F [Pseudomonadota bacterium]
MNKNTKQVEIGASEVLWQLSDLYNNEDDSALVVDIQWCTDEAQAIRGRFRGQVATLGAKDLLGLVVRLEALDCRITR